MEEYKAKKFISVYDPEFKGMPEGEQIDVLFADDCSNVVLPNGQYFHCGCDDFRVRVIKAKNVADVGTFVYGNRGGRLYI